MLAILGAGAYVGWNIGANDTANCVGTSVGCGLISFRNAVILVSVFALLGSLLQGQHVMHTIGKGIVKVDLSYPAVVTALICSGFFVTLATFFRIPTSTSQAIVGGVVGIGLALKAEVNTPKLIAIAESWIICPIMVMVLAFVLMQAVNFILKKFESRSLLMQHTMGRLAILSACYVAYSMGANNAGNAVGPIANLELMRPKLLLLIGGTAGSGKSTLATELASCLDIFRTQSTDMLREIMRAMLPERLLPILHRSSFEAWRVLPEISGPMDFEDKIAHGYRGQTDLVSVLCEAVVQRAVRESVSMVLEGVHIDATTVNRLRESGDIIVVPIMLAVLKQEVWRKRIQGRGRAANQRRAQRYLKSFETIWQLQSHLLSEADGEDISIVVNDDRESTIAEVLRIIGDTLSAVLEPTVKKVFPANA